VLEPIAHRCPRPRRVRVLFSILAFVLVGCGGGPRGRVVAASDARDVDAALEAYEDYAASDGDDIHLLARIASVVLLEAACGPDQVIAALAVRELSQTGLMGQPVLAEVVHRDCTASFEATVLGARRGDVDALRLLRGHADDPTPSVRAAVVIALSPELDREILVRWARDEDDAVRAAASERLGALGPSDAGALAILIANARGDASARVRARAVRALGSYGGAAFEPLRERLSDPEAMVRMAAVEALVRTDRIQARGTLLDLLATPPSPESIEAARLLMSSVGNETEPSEDDRTASLAYLRAALSASDASLRAQAAVVLVGIPGVDTLGDALATALRAESDPAASLSMARALIRRATEAGLARDTLRGLISLGGMSGTQAAVVLAEENDVVGLETLRSVAIGGASDTNLRVVALHALGRLHPHELASVLRDADLSARLAAASAILGAAGG
jgi:hypothetical protein